jgi:uncharacterized membrane protein
MPKSKVIPFLEAFLAVLVWGASFIATKVALRDISPITVVWLRFAMGVVILGIAVMARKQFAWPKRSEWLYFALLGFLGITFHQWLQSTALTTSRASTTAWIVATTPVFMALLGLLILREKLNWLQTAGILLAATGVILVVSNGDLTSLELGNFGAPGDILVLISAFNWAVFSTLSRRGLASHPATRMMFYVMTLGWFKIRIPQAERILWVLVADDETMNRQLVFITNVPLVDLEMVQQVYNDWHLRTRIEHGYHFDQEQGLDIEDLRVQTVERMRRLFAMVSLAVQIVFVISTRWPPKAVLWLRHVGRKLGISSDRNGLMGSCRDWLLSSRLPFFGGCSQMARGKICQIFSQWRSILIGGGTFRRTTAGCSQRDGNSNGDTGSDSHAIGKRTLA